MASIQETREKLRKQARARRDRLTRRTNRTDYGAGFGTPDKVDVRGVEKGTGRQVPLVGVPSLPRPQEGQGFGFATAYDENDETGLRTGYVGQAAPPRPPVGDGTTVPRPQTEEKRRAEIRARALNQKAEIEAQRERSAKFLKDRELSLTRGTARKREIEGQRAEEQAERDRSRSFRDTEDAHERELEKIRAQHVEPKKAEAAGKISVADIQKAGGIREAEIAAGGQVDVATIEQVAETERENIRTAAASGDKEKEIAAKIKLAKLEVYKAFRMARERGEIVGSPQWRKSLQGDLAKLQQEGLLKTQGEILSAMAEGLSFISSSESMDDDEKLAAKDMLLEELGKINKMNRGSVGAPAADAGAGEGAAGDVVEESGVDEAPEAGVAPGAEGEAPAIPGDLDGDGQATAQDEKVRQGRMAAIQRKLLETAGRSPDQGGLTPEQRKALEDNLAALKKIGVIGGGQPTA